MDGASRKRRSSITRVVASTRGVLLAWLLLTSVAIDNAPAFDFAHDVAPTLREHCGKCHLGKNKKGGLSFNTRAAMLAGGDEGPVIIPGRAFESKLIEVIVSRDADTQMPPQGKRLSDQQVERIKTWINTGATWDDGFVFDKPAYEPPLKPRRPELPPIVEGRANPVDRLIDADLAKHKTTRPAPLDDAAFARRSSLDLRGLLPDVDRLKSFLDDNRADRRERWIKALLDDDTAYAEHWLTFWNDLLRNDYGGTGFITGGRKQISKWLYQSLIDNKPYDQMVRELIAPTPDSSGFGEGIRWRGTVSAGQTVEIQFAQSVGQAFLGINLKCASCHDSFIDRWKLDEAYGMAAIYSNQPLEISRCDKPVGRTAKAGWLFPELGEVVAADPQPERLKQLAALMTHPDNGRVTRTMVNRLWHRLMGHGIVHPVDAMQTEPWNADLLDFLATDFADHKHDLKHTIALIANSAAYQSRSEVVGQGKDDGQFVYAGPRAKRLTAEQFIDAVASVTGAEPKTMDAPVVRGKLKQPSAELAKLAGKWVWSNAEASTETKAGETIALRKRFDLPVAPLRAGGVFTCDNSCVCYVNGQKLFASNDFARVEGVVLHRALRNGANEVLVVGTNAGGPGAIFSEIFIRMPDGTTRDIGTDGGWEWTSARPGNDGKFATEPTDWAPAVPVANQEVWGSSVSNDLLAQLTLVAIQTPSMIRASLLKSDALQRALGRPTRDQIVTTRPNELSTLEAIDLNNDQTLADKLATGAKQWIKDHGANPVSLVDRLYLALLSRSPTSEERSIALEMLVATPGEQGVEDLLWAILMQPEFQLVR